jgi:hypothetical protein
LPGPPQCFGVSGYSGAGTAPSERNDPEKLRDNLMPYSLVDHLHEREVSRQLGVPVEFMPHVASHFPRAHYDREPVVATIHERGSLRNRYLGRYGGEALVEMLEDAPWVSRVAGAHGRRNRRLCTGSRRSARLVVVACRGQSAQGRGNPGHAEHQSCAGFRGNQRHTHEGTAMSDLLWQKAGVQSDQRVMRFLAGDDVLLDREFFLHDIEASKAHVEGLLRIGKPR